MGSRAAFVLALALMGCITANALAPPQVLAARKITALMVGDPQIKLTDSGYPNSDDPNYFKAGSLPGCSSFTSSCPPAVGSSSLVAHVSSKAPHICRLTWL